MKYGRCHGCGKRSLLVAFRGYRCISCVAGATEHRGDDSDWYRDNRLPQAPDREMPTQRLKPARAARPTYPPEIWHEARRLKAAGLTLRAIAERLGVSVGAVRCHVPSGHVRRSVVTEDRLREMQSMRAAGMTLDQIGHNLGVTGSYICRILNHGMPGERKPSCETIEL